LFFAIWPCGCATLPDINEHRKIEVGDIIEMIECELAAAARDPELKSYAVPNWGVKSSLDLTLVSSLGADGKVAWSIPFNIATVKLTPNLSWEQKDTSTAHIDFVTQIPEAIRHNPHTCAPAADPSGTGLGLAAWFKTTLLAVGIRNHAGLSYTVEFQVTLTGAGRFGYSIVRLDADVGTTGTTINTHRLTVAIAPPPPPASPAKPLEVVIVGDRTVGKPIPESSVPTERSEAPSAAPKRERRVRRPVPNASRAPLKDDTVLDNLLLRQAPVRIQPGTLVPR
jgi:hypothetical protein